VKLKFFFRQEVLLSPKSLAMTTSGGAREFSRKMNDNINIIIRPDDNINIIIRPDDNINIIIQPDNNINIIFRPDDKIKVSCKSLRSRVII
jgi:hypothetical protein